MRYLILLWILLACGCKSIKKDKSITISTDVDSTAVSIQEEIKVEKKSLLELLSQDWEMEDRIETHQAFDSAGITVFKPVVHTRTTSLKSESVSSSMDSVVFEKRDSISGSLKSQELENLELHKESEGQEVVGQIVNGVVDSFIPSWTKYFTGMLILLTGLLYWLWLNRKLKKEKDGIPPP